MTDMDAELEAFSQELLADVLASADAENTSAPEIFTRRTLEDLEQAGEVENVFAAFYSAHGVEASGYGTNEVLNSLDLFITHFSQVRQRLQRKDIQVLQNRVLRYAQSCSKGLKEQLDEFSDEWDMAFSVEKSLTNVSRIRVYLLTNSLCPTTDRDEYRLDGTPVSFHVWDLNRLARLASSGTLSEPIVVDFSSPLPCLATPRTDEDYSVLLSILSGDTLADLYGQYGTRLLELNVRSFLQARGTVNRGIRNTLLHEPDRFLAYNNGITATASHVEFAAPEGNASGGALQINRIHDLQIVNGGQTTASLHYARTRDHADISTVYVQMKLTVVASERLPEIVPEISKYSNTQNKVTVVDFSSNHPFHVGLEQMTRSLWAPATDGSSQETRWFYERARGQYSDALARERTPANQRKFRALHPAAQKFSKSDAAKYLHSWRQLPHLVSRGAEKNFHTFMTMMGDDVPTTDALFSQRLIATAILFKSADRIVATQQFGGYKINITAYTVAKLSQASSRRIDLDRIWREQNLTNALQEAIREISVLVQRSITSPPTSGMNIGEWTKRPECWEAVSKIVWSPSDELAAELVDMPQEDQQSAGPDISATVSAVHAVAASDWSALSAWARETQNLQPWERQLASTVARYLANGWPLTERQASQANRILTTARTLGFRTADDR